MRSHGVEYLAKAILPVRRRQDLYQICPER
jgi:hypothetical protein